MQDIVERRLRRKSEHYPAVYDAIIGHINRFSQLYDCDIYTNSVTEEFLDDFIIYLQNEGLRHNTIVGYVQKYNLWFVKPHNIIMQWIPHTMK